MKSILPQNYRVIPAVKARENLSSLTTKAKAHTQKFKTKYLITLFLLETAVLLTLVCLLVSSFLQYKAAQQARLTELKNLTVWEKLITKYPKYPEVYYGAALHAERVGDHEKALEYVNKSLQLNSNFEAGKKLLRELTR